MTTPPAPQTAGEFDWVDDLLLTIYLGDSDAMRSQKHQIKINPTLAKCKSAIQAQVQRMVLEAQIAKLGELEVLPNVYPEKIRGQYTHVRAIYTSAITDEIFRLQAQLAEGEK